MPTCESWPSFKIGLCVLKTGPGSHAVEQEHAHKLCTLPET